MIRLFQKRVVIGLSLSLLVAPSAPTKAYDYSTNNPAVVGCLVGAGILGVCGLIYGLVQASKKSPEQIADDARKAFDTAHAEGRLFYTEYLNTFERASYGEPLLEHIEQNFLKAVTYRAHEKSISIQAHIDNLKSSISTLRHALKEVKDAITALESSNKTHKFVYELLVVLHRDIEAEIAYLNAYHHRFSDHRAYFTLAQFESKLHARYQREIALPHTCVADSYYFEKQLLHIARAYDIENDYPLVRYHSVLRDNIATLERHIRELKYWYPERAAAAQQLLEYLIYIRNLLVDTLAFKEERERKKEDDARRELLALRQREVQAQVQMGIAAAQQAQAATMQAQAAAQQARAAQQQVYLEQARLAQQPAAVVVVTN